MSSFSRALAGELYLFSHRRSIRIAHLAVFLLSCVLVVINLGLVTAAAELKGAELIEMSAYNFWPQWSAATHTCMYLVELLVVLQIAGALPHEVASAATRDPLSRRISRTSLIMARSTVAVLLPLTLFACALIGSALTAAWLFDAGDIIEGNQVLVSVADLGLDKALYKSMLHAVLPLITLSVIASACGAIFKRAVLSVGVCFVMVMSPTMFYSDFKEQLPYYFADFLPAFGPDSFLNQTAQFSAGDSTFFSVEYEEMAAIGWVSPLPYLAAAVLLSILFFRKRSL